MNMIPRAIPNCISNAERRVFDSLMNDTDSRTRDWIVLHSLGVSQHHYREAPEKPGKRYAEIDFIVITNHCIVALEVKGGQVSCTEGIWRFTDRYGQTTEKKEGPYKQVSDAMFSLQALVEGKIQRQDFVFNYCCGVVFSDMRHEYIPSSPEWEGRPIFTSEYWNRANAVSGYIRQIEQWYQQDRQFRVLYEIPAEYRERLKQFLRPEIDVTPKMFESVREIDVETTRLTEEQYQLLDYVNDCTHVLIQGGAGSGKTYVALEKARRNSSSGSKTLLLCSTKLFASYLRNRLNPEFNNVSIKCLSELTDKDKNTFNTIILDEAQDFIDMNIFERLSDYTVAGLENSCVYIFYDYNQIVDYSRFEEDVLQYLRTCYAFTPITMNRNCRNTLNTVQGIFNFTGITYQRCLRGEGPMIQTLRFDNMESLKKCLISELGKLVAPEQRIDGRQITILYDNEGSRQPVIDAVTGLHKQYVELVRDGEFSDELRKIKIAMVDDYKGQENDFIMYVLGATTMEEVNDTEIYLSLSRTKVKAYLFYSSSIHDGLCQKLSQR